MATYLVDSNLFIQAHRVNYPLDVVTGFWKTISDLAEEDKLCSIDKVKKEIYDNDDDLKEWCEKNLPETFFKNSEKAIQSYKKVTDWAVSQKEHYLQSAINEFLEADVADAWLVAYAFENDMQIVTQEVSQPERKNRIKIPEVCTHFEISYKNMIELFRELGVTF